MRIHSVFWNSPLGTIEIKATSEYIISLTFDVYLRENVYPELSILQRAILQLKEYFQGVRKNFSLPYQLAGTQFQKRVWNSLKDVNYACLATYRDIATQLNNPNACRAVGNAARQNPLPIIVPCHRIVGSNWELKGFGSGIWRKKWLLEHENYHRG